MASCVAGLFPGQGSHRPGMREFVEHACPDLLRACDSLVGEDPFPRVSESTQFAQPAVYSASYAAWSLYGSQVAPRIVAGHSLGELCALVAAGAMSPSCGLEVAVIRGRIMADVAPAEPEGMLALVGTDIAYAEDLSTQTGVVVGNYNSADQFVLSGSVARLEAARARAREDRVTAVMLDVPCAFHSPSMRPAVTRFREAMADVAIDSPRLPVLSASTGEPFREIRDELAEAIALPVRWLTTQQRLQAAGATTFVDFGPGSVLAGLVRRSVPGATVIDESALRSGED